MKAQDRVAALTAIRDAIDHEIKQAKNEMLDFHSQHGLKGGAHTPWGDVMVVEKSRSIGLEPEFDAWVEENYPDEIETVKRVRASFTKAMLQRLVIVKDSVIDSETGEVVPWAIVLPPPDPHVSYPASSAQREAKALAREVVSAGVDNLMGSLLELTEAQP